ncbi:hypothetical protein BOTBODRAFT_37867 [Botryobasidium botryosum FD-172 SS1]|uniref:G domain-containing protein n=1 Tax=Botryobasidium botryosum (strain FD-172 SS1) TaxID=930990 RepID=A0A067M1J0_BOTB1|nr:hypothetical protein BOTBODRAFT_37867 [Botryobasidium botryosum FD-172 SS1]
MSSNSGVLIAVMGPTGAGKTTLVNKLTGSNFKIGYGLESETQQIQTATCALNGESVHLIDTPGFDDTDKTDTDILNLISNHLATSYRSGSRLTGVLYLHRITDNRVGGVSYKNMKIFEKLCGDSAMASVTLCTTMWGQIPEHIGAQREAELAANFWKGMIGKGATMRRVLDTQSSVTQVVSSLISLRRPVTLEVQREIVDQGKAVSETAAARDLNREKEALRLRMEAELERTRQEARRQMEEQERRLREQLEQQRRAHEAQLAREAEQRRREEENRRAERARLERKAAEARRRAKQSDDGCVIF